MSNLFGQQKLYPIGIQSFTKIRAMGFYYVDKTGLIYRLVKTGTSYFLSRPRRFGKSLLLSTLESYFRGEKAHFQGLALEQLEQDWTEHPVLHFDFSGTKYKTENDIDHYLDTLLLEMEKQYGREPHENSPALRLRGMIRRAYEQTGQGVVLLIDEYDAPLLDVMGNEEQVRQMRKKLQQFFSPIKSMDSYLRFVFLTGITKFSQMSIFSELNNLQDISMSDTYSDLCGINRDELLELFRSDLQQLADKNHLTYEEACLKMEKQYDGYHFSPYSKDIYNPFSVFSALNNGQFGLYWFRTGTPTFLVELLERYKTDMQSFENARVSDYVFDRPTESLETPIALLYQSGYLTIKHYAPLLNEYTLDWPNEEVRTGMMETLFPHVLGIRLSESDGFVRTFIRALMQQDLDEALVQMRAFMSSLPYDLEQQTEKHYQTVFYLIFRLVGIIIQAEVRSSAGRADAVVYTPAAIYVFEFKLEGSVDEALAQIDRKGYLIPYTADGRKLYKVEVGFDKEHRTIGKWRIKASFPHPEP